jgi:hypothetical protein
MILSLQGLSVMMPCRTSALRTSRNLYNLFVFSDHGQSDVQSFFYPNEILAQSRWREHLINKQIRFVGDGSGSLLFYSSLAHQQNREIMDYFSGLNDVNHFYTAEEESSSDFKPVGIIDLNHTVCGEDIMASEQPKYLDMVSLHGYQQCGWSQCECGSRAYYGFRSRLL